MITKLDQYSWAKELETGNAQFVKLPDGTLYIVSNVLATGPDAGKFKVLRSDPVPPAPGPGNSFTVVAEGILANTTIDFDPVVSWDSTTNLLHILGTVDNPSINPQLTDLAMFTYDTTYGGPYPLDITSSAVTLIQGTSIQYAYDIVGLDNGIVSSGGVGHSFIAAGVSNPIAPPLFQTTVTNVGISLATLTVTCNNLFSVGQLIALTGFTGGDATFLNGAQVQITTVSPTQFTALYYYRTLNEAFTIPLGLTITPSASWESDLGVVYAATGLPLTKVVSSPQVGEYTVASGVYTFNAADQAKGVQISYEKFYSQAQTSGLATPAFSGQSLIAFELDGSDNVVTNSLKVLTNSPDRTGNVVSSVSLVSADGVNVEVYYESHPKLLSFKDQVFDLYQINLKQTLITETHTVPNSGPYTITVLNSGIYQRDAGVIYAPAGAAFTNTSPLAPTLAGQYSLSGATYTFDVADAGVNIIISYYVTTYSWDLNPTTLTQLQARFTDERLTVFADSANNRYLSQTFYSQFNHPEGLVGNALLGHKPSNGAWVFHPTYGSSLNGSIVQGVITVSQTQGVNFLYLLQPFQQVPPPQRLAGSYPLHVATVDVATMSFTDVPGFYNQQSFTWMRGSKSIIDDASLWAGVGEQLVLVDVLNELQLIPAKKPYALLVNHAAAYWQNSSVVDQSGSTAVTFTPAINNPAQGQYTAQANGLYTFNANDASVGIIGLDLTNNQITVTGTNISNLKLGQKVLFGGLTHSTYLNGVQTTVTSIDLSRDTFTATYVHADDPEHSETGLAGKPISISYNYVSQITPTYISFFNVPPVASMTPSYPTVVTIYRNQPFTFNANASSDGDQDPLSYIWTESDPDLVNVTITPSNYLANLKVAPGIGGNNQAHITNVSLTSNVVTFSAVNTFNPGDIVLVKNLSTATFLNGQVLTVATTDGLHFTASFTHADYPSFADSGDAGVYRYFDVGLAVLDLNGVTPRHPAYAVTNIAVDNSGNVTVTTPAVMANGEKFMLYSIATDPGGVPISDLNDREFIVSSVGVGTITATVTVGSAPAQFTSAAVTGFLIPQYQYQFCQIQVPFNAAPTITFPTPNWSPAANPIPYTYISVPRNTSVSLVINPSGSVPYPVTVTGLTDNDDAPTYLWEQLSGTTVLTDPVLPPYTLPNSQAKNLTFHSNGVDIHGETLTFRLTVNDGVNPSVIAYFAIVVAAYSFATMDTKKLSRAEWTEQDAISNVEVSGLGVLTITANNTYAVGQAVTFSGLQAATFLNGETVTVDTVSATQFTAQTTFSTYASTPDVGVVSANARISQRNSAQTWSSLDQSAIYTDLGNIKRTSILDGSDRYIVISKATVLVYGGVNPNHVLLRRLLSPISSVLVDAVHTEDDTTYVIDDLGNLYRFSTAPLINTDNPDTTIDLSLYAPMAFTKITCTYSHANVRILALSGPEGCMLMEVANDTAAVTGVLLLTTESNLVVGSNNVQFVRMSNVETLNSGKILLGTVTNVQATVTAIQITNNALTVTCLNNFLVGDVITFSGFTGATAFLNGQTVTIIGFNTTGFIASLEHVDLALTPTTAGSIAVASNDGKTYETLIDMANRQIIGTWDASKLKNQFVQTGEILFEPDSTYSGRPTPPVVATPTSQVINGTAVVTLAWTQQRPDLVSQYNIEYTAHISTNTVPLDGSQVISVPNNFGADLGAVDETTTTTLTKVTSNPGPTEYALQVTGAAAIYSFNVALVGDIVVATYQTPYTVLQIVTSGAIQTVTFPLVSGTYSFRMQAVGADGVSDYSNVVTISF